MTTLTNAELTAIRKYYSEKSRCPDCESTLRVGGVLVHTYQCRQLKARIPALLDTIAELREVVAEMATTPPLGSSVHREWDKRIARARAALGEEGAC